MAKKVKFNPKVRVRQGNKEQLIDIKADNHVSLHSNAADISFPVFGIFTGLSLIMFGVWIAGLIKMGSCGGASSGFFWATLLLFILLPGPGTIVGFIMAVVALATLKPGKTALGITCPAKK